MPTDVSFSFTMTGTSTNKGAIGPRTFAQELKQITGMQEIEVEILPGDVDKVVNLPPVTNPKALIVFTDLPCSFKKGAESVVHALPAKGMHIELGTLASLSSLSFTGSASPKASVYIGFGG